MRTRRELLGLGCCRTPSSATPPNPRRAPRGFSCMPPNPSRALPVFPCSPPNPRRAVPPIPCSWYHLCRALRPIPCRPPCTSPVSLHEFASMQGFGGSARPRAGIKGKCTSPCRNQGEVHVSARLSHTYFAVHFARNVAGRRAPRSILCSWPYPCRTLRPIPCRGSISCKESGEVHGCSAAARPSSRASPKSLQDGARSEPISGRPPGPPDREACRLNAGRAGRFSVKTELVRMGGVYLQLDTI